MSDIGEKIKWADKHIGDFKIAMAKFNSTKPYGVRVDTEAEPGKSFIHILKADPVPAEISLIAGHVIQNLRSTFDYLACALVRANGNVPSRLIEFPIFDEPITSKLESRFRGKVDGMRKVHRLNIADKHKMLVPAWGNGSHTANQGHPPIPGKGYDRLKGVVIENRHACEVMKHQDGPQTLHHVDPPYVHETRRIADRHRSPERKDYRHEMTNDDHERLADILHGLTGMVMLSGHPCDLYDNLYRGWQRVDRKAFADGARERIECLW